MSFWLDDYARLLDALVAAGREPQGVADFLRRPSPPAAILRHDVDRRPGMAVRMAEREKKAGVRATYYFRCGRNGAFPEAACRRIADLGHETGYHFEDLARCGGNRDRARESFGRNLAGLRRIVPCVTVSMHGSPLSEWNNADLLADADLGVWQLLGDATTSVQEFEPVYFTDAGGAWNDSRANFRDRVGTMPAGVNPLDPRALTTALSAHADQPAYFNLHPERWASHGGQFALSLALDGAARLIKTAIRRSR